MPYDMSQPVDDIFNAIDALAELAEHASFPLTDIQCVNIAYIVFSRYPVLLQDLHVVGDQRRARHAQPVSVHAHR